MTAKDKEIARKTAEAVKQQRQELKEKEERENEKSINFTSIDVALR